ncbi:FluC/FEX family fluoride channel [Nanchangia anserum]|uniref:Fluoride-specific ion channel FluC n=1 Tax=Nanchangia anserum TaxID=2692125 RepID=A0A8I0GBD2_9ACTO|nr:CrcB family protein [Nanchangia anserum]MBD3689668.1 CrcB family protein [Nanchangia anserum]
MRLTRDLAALAAGACLGGWARAGLDLALSSYLGALAVSTIIVNLGGAFVLGVLTGWVRLHHLDGRWRLALGTGFCGALTTYSSLMLVLAGPLPVWGAIEVVVLLGVGVGVAWGGVVLGSRWARVVQ